MRRKLALAIAALAVLLLASAVVARFWNLDSLRHRIVAEIAAQIGGKASIGRLRLSLLPLPHLILEDVSLTVPSRLKLESTSASVHPRLLPLLRGQLRLSRIHSSGLDVALSKDQHAEPKPPSSAPVPVSPLAAMRAFVASQAPGITLAADRAHVTMAPLPSPALWIESADDVRLRVDAGDDGSELLLRLDTDVRSLALRRDGEKFVLTGAHLRGALHARGEVVSIELTQTRLDDPRIAISGQLMVDPPAHQASLNLEGRDLRVDRLLAALTFLTAGAAPARGIADVLRGGVVPHISASAKGESLSDLARLSAFRIVGRLQEGNVRPPATGFDLEEASGDVTIEAGVLSASNVAARFGSSSVRDGSVRVGLTDSETALSVESRGAHIVLAELYSRAEAAGSLPDFLRGITGITGSADLTQLSVSGKRVAPGELEVVLGGSVRDFKVESIPQLGAWHLRTPLSFPKFKLSREEGKISATGRAEAGGATGAFEMLSTPGRFELSRLELRDANSNATLRWVSAPDTVELGFSGQLVKETLDALLTDNPVLAGAVRGELEARLSPGIPLRSTAKGNAEVTHLTIPGAGKWTIAKLSLQADTNRFAFDADVESAATGKGKLIGAFSAAEDALVADATLNAGDVDLEALLGDTESAQRRATQHDAAGASRWRGFLQGKVKVQFDSLRYGRFRWTPFRAEASLTPGGPVISVREARLCGLNTTGSAQFQASGMRADATLAVENEPVEQAIACLTGREHALTGTGKLDADLQAEGTAAQIPRSTHGTMRFAARNGRIHEMQFIAKALTTINVATGGFKNAADLRREGLPYDRLSVLGDVRGGKLHLSEGVLEGPTVKMTGSGSVDLIDGNLDVTLLVAPLRSVDSVVGKVPVVGGMLGGSLVAIPVRVTGRIGDPTVTPLDPSAVGSELKGLMERTLRLPQRALRPFLPGKRAR